MIKVIAFEGSSNVGKTTLIKAYAKKLQNEGNLVFIHKPTGDESIYGKEYDIFSFDGVDKEYVKPYQVRYQKERDFTIDNINCLTNNEYHEAMKNIYITNICQGKLDQLHVVRMLLNNIETNKDIYLLVDRTIISTLVYGYSYKTDANLEELVVNRQYSQAYAVKNIVDVFVNVTREKPFNLPEEKLNGEEFDKTFDQESMSKHEQYQKLYQSFFDVSIGNHKVVTIDVANEEPDTLASELHGMVSKVDVSGMTWYEFMRLANRTNATYNADISKALFHDIVGILGESNEIYDNVTIDAIENGKTLTEEQIQNMLSEMGDTLWYCGIALYDIDRFSTLCYPGCLADNLKGKTFEEVVDETKFANYISNYILTGDLKSIANAPYREKVNHTDDFILDLFRRNLKDAVTVIDDYKKHYFYGQPLDSKLAENILFLVQTTVVYLSRASVNYGMNLESIADAVIKKLKARYPNKFSVEDSINRDYSKESEASGLLGK